MKDIERLIALARNGIGGLDSESAHYAEELIARVEKRTSRDRAWLNCLACRAPSYDNYMVHDDLWLSVFPARGFAHLACLEKRVGRQLRIEDFTLAPVNHAIMFGYLMGRKEKG